MSHRLQLLVPEDLDGRIQKAARRLNMSKGEWVRRAVRSALKRQAGDEQPADPVEGLATLDAPTGDIEQMLTEIKVGRS